MNPDTNGNFIRVAFINLNALHGRMVLKWELRIDFSSFGAFETFSDDDVERREVRDARREAAPRSTRSSRRRFRKLLLVHLQEVPLQGREPNVGPRVLRQAHFWHHVGQEAVLHWLKMLIINLNYKHINQWRFFERLVMYNIFFNFYILNISQRPSHVWCFSSS